VTPAAAIQVTPDLPPCREQLLAPIDADALRPMLAPRRTLLLVIDIQNDFAAPQGAMGRLGLDLSAAEAAIDRIEALLAAARACGVAAGFARVLTSAERESRALRLFHERRFGDMAGTAICRDGSWGAEHYRLSPCPGDLQIGKRLYSCFESTALARQLHERGIDTIVITGMTTDCCVSSTVRHGFELGFNLFIAADACADYEDAAHRAELAALGRHCALLTDSARVRAAWTQTADR